jgi:hypothetical protein
MLRAVALDQIAQPGLINRNLIRSEHLNLPGINVGADDIVARLRQARSNDKTDIASSYDTDVHDDSK